MKILRGSGPVGLGLLVFLGLLWGCKEKPAEGPEGSAETGQVAVLVAEEQNAGAGKGSGEVVKVVRDLPKWSRASAGFARYLPKDTDLYYEARKLDGLWELFGDFKPAEVLDLLNMDEIADAAGQDESKLEKWKAQAESELTSVFPALFGEEVFVSVRGLDWWLQPYIHYVEEVSPLMVTGMVKMAADGDWFMGDDGVEDGEAGRILMEYMKQRLDRVKGKPVFAVQMGGRVREGRGEVLSQLQGWIDLAAEQGERFEKVSFQRNGVDWKGIRMDWAPWLRDALKGEESLEGDQESLESLLRAAENLPLMAVSGEVGDYVVLSIGLGEHSVEIVTDIEQSLVADEAFDFLTEYELDSVLGVSWSAGKLTETIMRAGSSAPTWMGAAEGFRQSERLETGPLVAESLEKVARLSRQKEAGKAYDSVGAIVLKDGIHLVSRGGWLGSGIDLESPLNLAAALDRWEEKPFFRAHWKAVEEHSDMTLAQFEELAKVVRIIGAEISEAVDDGLEDFEGDLDEDEQEEAEAERQLAESMRRDFLKGMENLWVGYRDHFRKSLGEEVALVMDLEGEAPPIVGLDEKTLEKGRIPRLAYVRPVRSREGLQQSWVLWRDAGVRFLGLISEMLDTPIPFPDTLSADSNELRTHFFAMPFATDDFLPSLSVGDELFIVGSSKALASKIDKAMRGVDVGDVDRSGILVELEMGRFWDFTEAWLQVAVEKRGSVNEMTEEDFEAMERPLEPEGDAEETDPGADVEDMLRGDAEPESDDPDPAGELEEQVEKSAWADLGEIPFLDLGRLKEPGDYVQWALDQARWWKGVSYRRWLEDGVPHSAASIHWGDPAE